MFIFDFTVILNYLILKPSFSFKKKKIENDLPVGIKNMNDPYVSYSYIDLKFQLVSGASSFFLPDLGLNVYGINDGDDIGCEYILGLTAYTGVSLQCILIQGPSSPTNSDYAIVRISNYASIFAGISGKRVIFNIPLVSPQCNFFMKY